MRHRLTLSLINLRRSLNSLRRGRQEIGRIIRTRATAIRRQSGRPGAAERASPNSIRDPRSTCDSQRIPRAARNLARPASAPAGQRRPPAAPCRDGDLKQSLKQQRRRRLCPATGGDATAKRDPPDQGEIERGSPCSAAEPAASAGTRRHTKVGNQSIKMRRATAAVATRRFPLGRGRSSRFAKGLLRNSASLESEVRRPSLRGPPFQADLAPARLQRIGRLQPAHRTAYRAGRTPGRTVRRLRRSARRRARRLISLGFS